MSQHPLLALSTDREVRQSKGFRKVAADLTGMGGGDPATIVIAALAAKTVGDKDLVKSFVKRVPAEGLPPVWKTAIDKLR